MVRQRKSDIMRKETLKEIYKDIRKIVINNEFKNKRYYLDKFSNLDNWSFRRS